MKACQGGSECVSLVRIHTVLALLEICRNGHGHTLCSYPQGFSTARRRSPQPRHVQSLQMAGDLAPSLNRPKTGP